MTFCIESALLELYGGAGGQDSGTALACVGSLARRELGPRSDVDLVLLHDGKDSRATQALAERLWYPLWDSGVRLDHSVRTPTQCAEVAGRELSAGVGLLDLRVIAGDAPLVSGARTALIGAWRTNARKRLPELLSSLSERRELAGDAAYLLEPDLKEARGGFRDMIMLRALAATWLTDRPHAGVEEPYQRLLDVRDALHITAHRSLDRLLITEVDEVAELLGVADADALRREVSLAARRIGHAVDLTSRAARQAVPERRVLSFVRRERRPEYEQAQNGLIIHAGEVGLGRGADPRKPLQALQAAALAAQRGLVLSPITADNLGKQAPALPAPWSIEARDTLLTLLSTGENLIPVWEALDLAGVVSRWLPEWQTISAQPQHSPIHLYTVDRHSVQTVAEAHRFLPAVERPDLLLLACLFHDIGKGTGAGVSHAEVGAPIAREMAHRIGLTATDAGLVERLVRHHLTLAALATQRDHDDPATLSALVEAVDGRLEVLNLLRRLTEADARAAGPAAWSSWRASLIHALADRTEGLLAGERHDSGAAELVDLGLARSVGIDGTPRIRLVPESGGGRLIIAARDRLGLFAETAGLLATHQVSVRSAVLHTVEGVAVNTWRVDQQVLPDLPDLAFLSQELQRLNGGDTSMLNGVRRREARVRAGDGAEPHVDLVCGASDSAVVVEVRTGDRAGLLYALGRAITSEGLSIRSAHISTLAGQAIDTFYLTEPDGSRPGQTRSQTCVAALLRAAGAQDQATGDPESRASTSTSVGGCAP